MRYLVYGLLCFLGLLIIAAIILMLSNEWAWHPLGQCTPASQIPAIAHHEIIRCKSYNWYSGFAANFGELTLITALIGVLVTNFRNNNCSVNAPKFCWRFGHPVVGTSFKACHKHHPGKWRKDDGKVEPEHIRCAYQEVPTQGEQK